MCFDTVCVIVPCGKGELTVSELIQRSVSRYRKAANKASVNSVKLVSWHSNVGVIKELSAFKYLVTKLSLVTLPR